MQPNSEIIITDTSCLILLVKIESLDLLRNFSNDIFITPEIAEEFDLTLPDWIKVRAVHSQKTKELFSINLDIGEASALALSLEIPNSLVIIDDLKARKLAEKMQMNYSGTLGLLLRAKQEGFIHKLGPLLDRVQNTNFRLSEVLIKRLLKEANES